MKQRLVSLLVIALMFGMTHATYAATFCVSTPDELQTAFTTAASNDEDDKVQIVQGTYTDHFVFNGAEDFDLTIEGGYTAGCASREVDPANTVIDANSTDQVLVLNGDFSDFVIDGLSLINGNATGSGGGLYIKTAGGRVTLSHNLVSENKATANGGGVYIENTAIVTLTDNVIMNNNAGSYNYGGGAYIEATIRATITNNIISGNEARYGGGVSFSVLSSVNLTGNDINSNTASYSGGAIFIAKNSRGTFTDNDITGNTASYRYGGAIFIDENSNGTFTDNDITGNTANGSYGYGGGVCFAQSSVGTFTGNVIASNTASHYGGGVYFSQSSTGIITDNVITGNRAINYSGGGVYFNSSSTGTLTGNDIIDNKTVNSGGGVHFGTSTAASLINNVISNNSVSDNGGGLYLYESDTTILINNTISNNWSNTGNGGGIWLKLKKDDDSADIYNNIIWNNSAFTEGNDLYINNDGNSNSTPSPINLFNNDFDQSVNGAYFALSISIDSSNLDNLDPLFVDDWERDYHLQAGSPCIDAGDNDAPSLPTTDSDGNPRIANDIVDMGAYEHSDEQPGTLRFSKANYKVNEGGTIKLTVERIDGSDGIVSVEYATSDDTATAPDDYTQAAGPLNWTDGDDAEKTFTVNIIDDSELEDNETFIVSLGNPTGGAELGEPDTAEVTIIDDDSTNCNKVTEIPKKECKALVALYDSTDGKNWLDNTGWNVTNTPCSWNEVTCQDGHVTRLSLKDNNLKGSISKKFFKLKKLKSLTLSGNKIDASILKNVKKFKNLTVLLLNNCKLSGKIPKSLMKLKKLDVLDLKDNCLKTKVSEELKKWLDEINPGWDDTQTACLY
jgi:parallel beta-helix repeat protein